MKQQYSILTLLLIVLATTILFAQNNEIRFEQNDILSDSEKLHFGIRQTDNYFDKEAGGLMIKKDL